MNDKLRAAHDKLQDAVAEIVSGDEWKRMLKVASKFHRYSTGGITYSKLLNSARSGPSGVVTAHRKVTARD